jgi:DNA-binding beta-propeller fold protein YncE
VTTGCGRRTNGDAALLGVREFHTWPVPPDGVTQPAPRSIAVGGNREVCVLDSAGRVLVYAANGQLLRQWRMPETAAGRPEGVVILKDGHVVVCDTHYHRVIEFDPQGGEVRRFGREGQGAGEFIYPVAVAVDDRERLYIAEYGSNDRVQVFTRTGVWVRVFGGFGTQPGQFQRPSGMVWHAGRVYVADAFNNRIQVFGEDGAFEGVLATPALRFPYDLKLGADSSLYVVEYGAGRVTRLALDGRLLGRYGQSGTGLGEFGTPWGLALPDAGRVLVADTGNRRLVELVLK